jgi:acyl-CoA synthetase (AMP-forming)/AMP-acid ligase II
MSGSNQLWEAMRSRTGSLGDLAAVQTPSGGLTFGELWKGAERLASLFRSAGVGEGQAAGLLLGNSPAFLTAFLALCRLDATVALLSPQYRRAELAAIANGVRLSSIVTDSPVDGLEVSRAEKAEGLDVLVLAGERREAVDGEALLKFSSGSTAEPKGIALAADSVIAEADAVTGTLGLARGDGVLAAVPLFHSYGFDLGVLPTLTAGSTLLLEDAFVPRRTLTALAERPVKAFLGVPAQYRAFLDARLASPPDLSRVRWLLSCTAPLAPETIAAFHERFGAPVCQHYGSSETGAVTNHVPSEVLARPASVGRAVSGVRIGLEDGEVVVASAAVARRYVLGAPPPPSPLGEGVFRTGDLGEIDSDGFLTLLGRRDALINVGGLKVSPSEVAATLERHPAVREAAVLGVPDGRGDEVVYGVVALSGSADETELLAFCRTALAEYKVPRRIEIRAALPRTASGKVRVTVEDLDG